VGSLSGLLSTDGSLYLATPTDPLFVILPILEQLRMKVGIVMPSSESCPVLDFFGGSRSRLS
jgi:hypothetical protein